MAASVEASILAPSLWDQAFSSLDSDLRNSLSSTRTNKRDVLSAVLREIEAKRDLALRKRWKYKKPNGDIVVIRDVLEKTARWINRFKATGDVIAQYDPAHLSLPWAAFRFLLQTAVSEIQVFGAMAEHLEMIARIITRYREFERLYLQGTKSELDLMLEEALTRLYTEILTHLAYAVRFFRDTSTVRLLKSPFRTVDEDPMHKLLAQESEVLKIAKLTDTDKLLHIEATVMRLSIQATMYSQSLPEQRYSKILDWLSMAPYYTQHQFVSQSRLPELGNWLLKHQDYVEWQASSCSSLLLLHGITGSGKSMLCSMIVDSLLSMASSDPLTAPFSYIYCANADVKTACRSSDDVMRTILGQLALDRTGWHKIKDFLCSEYDRQVATAGVGQLDLPKLRTRDCVRLILELAEQDPLTIVIDAIDTVKENEQHALISALRTIVLEADNVVKILITSRSSNRTTIASATDKQIQISAHETQPDMEIFVNHLVDIAITSKVLLQGEVSSALRSMLVQVLLDGAGEMFLWVRLQIERLCREQVEDDIIAALQNKLPEDLDHLYQETLSHIFKKGASARDTATKTFSWIFHMREPLTPSALLSAISNTQQPTLQMAQLMAICANLVVLDKDCNTIRFAHQSVKEFLECHDTFTGIVAHKYLASACIEACSRGPVSSTKVQVPSDDFYVYAAMYWPVHSKIAEDMAETQDLVPMMASFIFDEDFDSTLSFESWLKTRGELVAILGNDHSMKAALDAIPDHGAGFLFLVSVFGLTGLLLTILKHIPDLDVNQKNEHGHTPVYLAAALGHPTTVSVLVEHGAEVNVQSGRYGSPIHAACFAGHRVAVDVLLKNGADICCGTTFDNALQAACRGGHEDVALDLIEKGPIVRSEDDYEQALGNAARAGFVNVVERLQGQPFLAFNKSMLDKVMKKTRKAIQGGQLGVLRQFLDQQTNKRDALPPDAVALATLYNHKILVEFLLDQGISVEAEGAVGTPLRTACLLNHQPIARLLLDRGAELNACGRFGDALQAAAMKGQTAVLKLIIEEGANLNQQGGFYGTALQAAAYHGQRGAVELLLDSGADIHAEGYSKDAFHAAAEGGHQDVIMLMLRKGYKFQHTPPGPYYKRIAHGPSLYKALLRDASPGRDFESFRRRDSPRALTDELNKAHPPTTNIDAIFREAESESTIAQLNTDEIVPVGYKFRSYSKRQKHRPLEAAASAGCDQTVKLLLEQREILHIPEEEICDAIKAATSNSHQAVMEILLNDVATRQSIKCYVESILQAGYYQRQPQIGEFALAQASKHCSADEYSELKKIPVTLADKYRQNTEVDEATLGSDFANSCETGDTEVIGAMLKSKHRKALIPHEIVKGLQLCALNCQSAIARMLFESLSLKEKQSFPFENAFVAAASSGLVETMRMLISHWTDEKIKASSATINQALVGSSKSGHIDVVRFLVQDLSADVNIHAPDRPIDIDEFLFFRPADASSDSEIESESDQEKPILVSVISPLQAALRGIARFDSSLSGVRRTFNNAQHDKKKAPQHQCEEVIMFLVNSGSKLNDLGGQNVYPIYRAAQSCPWHIVESFILAGADINAAKDGENALFAAAGRELSSASFVRQLQAFGATIPETVEKQEKLLEQALRYFKRDRSSRNFNEPEGYFVVAPSLEYVFKEGPGAVLFDLLHRMPEITTSDIKWTAVLQMAAFLNDHPFVDMLLSRNTDVNAIGDYYSTALEAAARCGHSSMIQKLLDAGAKVNMLGGRWQTPLRAALVGGHIDVVETLLDHGADVELWRKKQQFYSEEIPKSALQLGIQSGDLLIVTTLLKHGVDAVSGESETLHPLILASMQGNAAIVQELLRAGAPVNVLAKEVPCYGRIQAKNASPIHAAIAGGHLVVTKLLLSHGVDIENNVQRIGTPLSLAVSKGHAEIVRLLLSAGADAINSMALSDAVIKGNIEIAKELLAAGSKAEPVLLLACRKGCLPMIELFLEKIYDEDQHNKVIDDVFAFQAFDDSVYRLLLDYVPPTLERFIQVCATGSVASLKIMLDRGGIDINSQHEANGDYPLQVAASHLQAEVVHFLLSNGAHVHCKSAKHGTPMMTALEAGAAYKLRQLGSKNAKSLVETLSLPDFAVDRTVNSYWKNARNSFHQFSSCERIVQLLVNKGANISDNSRPFGPALHLACLLGSKTLVELFLEKGAELNEAAGYFEKAIFAAILGNHADIVALLLQKEPMTEHIHTDFSTPLHFACYISNGAAVRMLLEHGADATRLDAKSQTPLSRSLEVRRWQRHIHCSPIERPLEIILRLADPLHVVENDLITAIELQSSHAEKTLTRLLDIAKEMVVSEALICHVLRSYQSRAGIIRPLMHRSGGIGVTAKMLETSQPHDVLEELLKHKPICPITPEILKSQKDLECMKLLLEIDTKVPITEDIVFRALEIGNRLYEVYQKAKTKDVLEILLDRNPNITVTKEMMQDVRCAADMGILLRRLDPGTRIPTDVVTAVSKLGSGEAYLAISLLLKFDSSIRVDPEVALRIVECYDATDALRMLLKHDPSMEVTEEIFLQVFGPQQASTESERQTLARLMHKYGKRLVFTDKVREVIDHEYPRRCEASKKKRFYDLRMIDKDSGERGGGN